jgi:hypothetical protein
MTEQRFKDKKSLRDWLISASGIALTSISFMGNVQDLEFQFSYPNQLLTVMEGVPEYFPEGEYLVAFKNSDSLDHDSLDYSKMAMVVAFEAKMARHNILIGGLNPLLRALADFEYCCTINKTSPAYTTAGIWVIEPINPGELLELKEILENYSTFYAFNDGSGFVTLNNGRIGKGSGVLTKI